MTMEERTIASLLKSQQWERAKGEMRAFAAMQGSHFTEWGPGNAPSTASKARCDRWEELDRLTEAFIKEVEDNSLHE